MWLDATAQADLVRRAARLIDAGLSSLAARMAGPAAAADGPGAEAAGA